MLADFENTFDTVNKKSYKKMCLKIWFWEKLPKVDLYFVQY